MATLYRHELKYLAPEPLLQVLEARVRAVMMPDRHAGSDGRYQIRSIYYDDLYDTCLRENEDGTDPREKFRVRSYNASSSVIHLELKQKQRGMCRKLSAPLSLGQCGQTMAGRIPDITDKDPALIRKWVAEMQVRHLHPVVVVTYDRDPFVWRQGNVRVTFDRNIRSSNEIGRFFDKDLPSRPVLPAGWHILEVKWDELLPDFINEMLQTGLLRQTSFSKYYLCRAYARGVPHGFQ